MRRHLGTWSILALSVTIVAGWGSLAASADESAALPKPEVTACANKRLPPEILDGAVRVPKSPLPVIDAMVSGTRLRLAVASDDTNRELGLMCVTALKPRHGMIFVFGASQPWEFWMKNTLVPLDMLWATADGTITTIAANVPASTRETPDAAVARRSGNGLFVIELADGEARADGLSVGQKLTLPPLYASQ